MTTREAEIIGLIHKEVKPALGCTEPIAVALAAARATELLAEKAGHACRTDVDFKVNVEVSGNILKNGMGVGIPGTGMIGLRIAAALGTVCGKSAYGLEVLKDLEDKTIARAKELVAAGNVTIGITDNGHKLYVKTTVSDGNHSAYAVVEDEHDNIVETSVDGNVSGKQSYAAGAQECGKSTKEYGLTGKEIFDMLLMVQYADGASKDGACGRQLNDLEWVRRTAEDIIEKHECLSVKELAVNGNQLMEAGFSGAQLGRILNLMLEEVIEDRLENSSEVLMKFADERRNDI